MKQRLARLAYGLLMRALWPAAALRWWWRSRREPGYAEDFGARFGWYKTTASSGALWIHAVSLGETRAAEPLILALRAERPGLRFLLTHGTATGRETGRTLLREGDLQTWLPFDSPGAVQRFLRHFRPSLGVLMETEIWPNLQAAARQAGVPMVLASARLSPRSLRQGLRWAALMRPAAASLTAVLAQTIADGERLTLAGAPSAQVTGNLKFDLQPDPQVFARGQAWRALSPRPIVLAAVWREGEDEALLAGWQAVLLSWPAELLAQQPLLLLVPRHPQRFDEVAKLVAGAGLSLSRRSTWTEDGPDGLALRAQVWLGDSLREMPAYYALADVALLGGSFAPLGGQNLIEAAACGCPVLMGPHTFNFSVAAELAIEAGAATRVDDLNAALHLASYHLLRPRSEAQGLRQTCRAFAQGHQGAAQRTARAVLALLPPQGAGRA